MSNSEETAAPPTRKSSVRSRLHSAPWRLVSLVLLIALVVVVVLWKPWQANIKASDRTVSVTGTANIKAEPDEYVFSPSYSFSNVDKQTALGEMTARASEMVAKLKALGVSDNQIKTNSTNYGDVYYPVDSGNPTYSLMLTVSVDNKDLAQKVQDYLLTTSPAGSVTPQATFSTARQKALQSQGRDKAEQDARAKADQSAKNLGFKVSKVKSVEDGAFDNSPCGIALCYGVNGSASAAADTKSSLSLQPGQNDLNYSVKVVFYIH